ncbi:hypothetical protein N7517_010986 [Penicillium concentricum]|uniref:Amidohydrolase-related domain-containing protein n=1 Tax=Penicillium concentricum TaxID=293559 RepID=A0A9W9RA11_9EURO|nr:uncharacterized protein N7517_010986 [Penicillium concentricum]KAJ5356377.1 hypothetical protein N7517_010986 [Penicillium concentricum]
MGAILLQGGTVLAHEGDLVKVLCDHDILIVGNKIEDIGQGLTLPDGSAVRVIDCQGKIVSPGFIDTHHHLWQSQRIKNWASDTSIEFDEDLLPEWWLSTLELLAKSAPFGDGRVRLGLGFDDFKVPRETVRDLWARCHALDSVSLLKEYDLLNSKILFSHINGIAESDAQILLAYGAHFSSTPETELQMGLGEPVAFNPDLSSNASIGIDCHSNNSGDILTQLRLGMQHARGVENVQVSENGEYPNVNIKLERIFSLGTIQGARAVNMADKIGSLEVGKLADIVIFNATSPSMVCAAKENPLAAVLLHANVGDIEVVVVDGVVRKECGNLVDVQLLDGINERPGEVLHQREISTRLLESRARIIERGRGQDVGRGMEFLYKTFG